MSCHVGNNLAFQLVGNVPLLVSALLLKRYELLHITEFAHRYESHIKQATIIWIVSGEGSLDLPICYYFYEKDTRKIVSSVEIWLYLVHKKWK